MIDVTQGRRDCALNSSRTSPLPIYRPTTPPHSIPPHPTGLFRRPPWRGRQRPTGSGSSRSRAAGRGRQCPTGSSSSSSSSSRSRAAGRGGHGLVPRVAGVVGRRAGLREAALFAAVALLLGGGDGCQWERAGAGAGAEAAGARGCELVSACVSDLSVLDYE